MHGEYKMPGGKLIVADVTVAGGKLADVQISGDFFLEPDSALDTINITLTGQPVPLDAALLEASIDHALGSQTRLYGISAAAIVTAVQRALEAV